MLENQSICFLGAGSMAEAMIAGIVKTTLIPAHNIYVLNRNDRNRIIELSQKYGIAKEFDKAKAIAKSSMIILATKPKDVTEAILVIKEYTNSKQTFLSLLAGVSTDYISALLQHKAPVIRAMPNTSATVGLSATAISPGKWAELKNVQLAQKLLESIGIVKVVDEEQLDAITGLSGTGPAYVYYLVEAMEKAAVHLGLNQVTARELVLQTIIGAGEMLKVNEESPQVLREKVTSPGGTTMAGIAVLESFRFQEGMIQAIKKATERSTELGKIYTKVE